LIIIIINYLIFKIIPLFVAFYLAYDILEYDFYYPIFFGGIGNQIQVIEK